MSPLRDGLALSLQGMAETLAISVPTLVDAARGRLSMEACDLRLERWARTLLAQAAVELHVMGGAQLPSDQTFIVMSNHRSLYDVPVLFSSFPGRLRMVAKSELFRVPVWGRAMRVAGFIEVDRNNSQRARASLRESRDVLDHGVSVWIAPEGTRSRDGSLGPFKSGGFRLALETGRKILPVAIAGTERILPAKGALVQRGARVSVQYGEPLDPQAYDEARRAELVATVRDQIARMLAQLEAPP